MRTSELPVRTQRAFEQDESFQQLMAARLRQSPWVALSGGVHAALLLLLWAMMPTAEEQPRAAQILVQDTTQRDVVQPEPPEKPEVEREVEVAPVELRLV